MSFSRRKVLALIGGTITGSLAGCGTSTTPTVDLAVSNITSQNRSILIEVLPESVESDLSENTIYTKQFKLGPNQSDTSHKQDTAVFDEQKALVRVKTNSGYIGEYTFVPDCPADGNTGEAINVRLVSANQVQFLQNFCG